MPLLLLYHRFEKKSTSKKEPPSLTRVKEKLLKLLGCNGWNVGIGDDDLIASDSRNVGNGYLAAGQDIEDGVRDESVGLGEVGRYIAMMGASENDSTGLISVGIDHGETTVGHFLKRTHVVEV